LRILHVIGSMNPISGGPCQGVRNLNTIFSLQNIYREVLSMDDPGSLFLGSDTFQIHALGPGKGPWQYSEKLMPWLIENIKHFDIIIVNGIWLYHEYAVLKAIRVLKRKENKLKNSVNKLPKVFLMPHGMLDPYFQKTPDRKIKAFRNWIYWNLIERKNIQEANGLLFTCEEELQLARKSFRLYKPKKEINVGYGIDEPPAFRKEMQIAFNEKCPGLKDSPYILFLGRIHSKKGVLTLLVAYIELFKLNKEKKKYNLPQLVIAGPGIESSYGKKIAQLILETPEVQSSVLFPGMLAGDAKWGALYGCDCFILPSHQENFGIAVVEALACRKPVLISNQINIWREIISKDGGFVREDTLQGTKELLDRWLPLSYQKKLKMAENARNVYEEHFSIYPAGIKFIKEIEEN